MGRLFCLLGLHDWRKISKQIGDMRCCKRCPKRQVWREGSAGLDLRESEWGWWDYRI